MRNIAISLEEKGDLVSFPFGAFAAFGQRPLSQEEAKGHWKRGEQLMLDAGKSRSSWKADASAEVAARTLRLVTGRMDLTGGWASPVGNCYFYLGRRQDAVLAHLDRARDSGGGGAGIGMGRA